MFTVKANFIDVFKIGDNINYNLRILKSLYEAYNILPFGKNLIKPIVIVNVSIAEAILHDFIVHRNQHPNRTEIIYENIRTALQGKEYTKFEHYITQVEKYDFFNSRDNGFYGAMRNLSKMRNRIHIQNHRNEKPLDESEIFNERLKILSEKVLEKILNTMTTKYARREEYHNFVSDFEIPWQRHFPSAIYT